MFDAATLSGAFSNVVANAQPSTPAAPAAPAPASTGTAGAVGPWGMGMGDVTPDVPGQWSEPPASAVAPAVKPKPALPLPGGNPADEHAPITSSPAAHPIVPQIDPAIDPHAAYAQAWHSDQPASALSPSTVALQKSAAEQSADAERQYQAAYTATHGVSGGA